RIGCTVAGGSVARKTLDRSTGCLAVALRRPVVRFPVWPAPRPQKKGGALAALFMLFHLCRQDQAADLIAAASGSSLNVSRSDCSITIAISRRRSNLSHLA